MPEELSDEQWRNILDLATSAIKYPKSQRAAFLESAGSSPDVIQQVLILTEAFEQPAFSTDRIGTKFGHFLITEHLGQGGMGDVYAAQDVELERKVALKFLNPDSLGVEGAGEKFIREARTVSALNHPNIVTIHEVIRSDATVAIVMELVDGVPLRQLCGAPLAAQRLIRIARQIGEALAAAHASGVVHRDMKPENVMVRPDGRVKVLDFGLARRLGGDGKRETSVTDVFAGTWRYMSPEQIKGDATTPASDIFSFGLILYELAAGRHPFQAASPFETLQAIAEQEAARPSKWNTELPESLESLIAAMLAKDPKSRPSAETILEALSEWETGSGAPSAVAAYRNRPPGRSRLWIGVSLALLAIAAVAFFYLPRNKKLTFYQATTLITQNRATAAAISPDGSYTAYANVDGVFLRANQTGETNPLHGPKDLVVNQLGWFAGGTRLVASGFSTTTNQQSIWSVSITGAEPRELRADARSGVPSPDGSRIAYVSRDRAAIWVMGPSGEEPRQVVSGPGDDTFPLIVWCPDGHHLGFQRRHYSGKADLGLVMLDRYYQRSFEIADVDSGKIVAAITDLWIESAAPVSDGRILFLRFENPGSHISNELWEMKVDASGAIRGNPKRVGTPPLGEFEQIYQLTATTSGKKLMVLDRTNQNAVFVADSAGDPPTFSNPRRLTLEERSNFPHAWTADSSSVIFESDRSGSWDIFKQNISSRTAEPIIATPQRWEVLPQLTPDGKSILYALGEPNRQGPPYMLMRISLDGGTPEAVPTNGPVEEFRCALHARCVLRTNEDRQYFVFREIDPVRGVGRELARSRWQLSLLGDWTLSPDGTEAAIPNHDSRSAKIRIVSWKGQPSERELDLPGLTDLAELSWSPDGKGWFVLLNTGVEARTVYIRMDGRLFSLGDVQGWVVPSPDGRKVAYLNRITATNAWIIE